MVEHYKLYKELSEKHNLPVDVIQKVCDSQFEMTKEVITSGKDEQVRLQYLGLFKVHPNRRKNMKARKERIKKIHDEKSKQKE